MVSSSHDVRAVSYGPAAEEETLRRADGSEATPHGDKLPSPMASAVHLPSLVGLVLICLFHDVLYFICTYVYMNCSWMPYAPRGGGHYAFPGRSA